MPIDVICTGCHARFKVSDKFAGKKGPCPKCKATIQVPALAEQVVIHAPEHSEVGARDSQGKLVLDPIKRTEASLSPVAITGIIGVALIPLVIAVVARGVEDKSLLLALGAIVLAPPLAWAGYTFLRDDELEPYRGKPLFVRTAVCGLVYALLWGVFTFVYWKLFGDDSLEIWMLATTIPFLAVGAGTAYVCYDLDFGSGFFHYCLYLLVTVLLRMVMDLPAI